MAISRPAAWLLRETSVLVASAAESQRTLRAGRSAPSPALPLMVREELAALLAAGAGVCAGLPMSHRAYDAVGGADALRVTVAGVPAAVPVMPARAVARRNTGIPCPVCSPAMFPYQELVPDSGRGAAGVVAALVAPGWDRGAGENPLATVAPEVDRQVASVAPEMDRQAASVEEAPAVPPARLHPRPGRIANHSSPVALAASPDLVAPPALAAVTEVVVVRYFPCCPVCSIYPSIFILCS